MSTPEANAAQQAGALLAELLEAIEQGLARPAILWQFVAIGAALGLGWLVSRQLTRRAKAKVQELDASEGAAAQAASLSLRGAARLAFPAVSLLLLVAFTTLARALHLLPATGLLQFSRLAFVLLVVFGTIRLAVYVLRTVFRNARWLASGERVIAITLWVLAALYITGFLREIVQALEHEKLPLGKSSVSVWDLLMGVFTVAVTVLLAMWSAAAIESRLMRSQLQPNLRVVLSRVAKAVLLVLAVLFGLSAVGIDLTVLSVFGGALGVGLGLGLQRIASNYVSGFIILIDHSLRLGDLITVDKYYGTVSQINTRYTVIKAMDGTEAIVPNEMLVSTPVTNHSYTDSSVRAVVKVSVAYDSDVERAMTMMTEVAAKHPRVLADPAPGAFLTGFAADGIDLELGVWIGDPQNGTLSARSDMALEILRRFRAEGIAIPFPQRDVRLVSVPSGLGTTLMGSGQAPGRMEAP
ncbi:MAG TPA: mechanosensitive ion channel [Burkholderiaceae bacterium]|nr:mechanosensitive ion channel [Burkholderiaceae bacterium]